MTYTILTAAPSTRVPVPGGWAVSDRVIDSTARRRLVRARGGL